MADFKEVQVRWDDFLNKIEERFEEFASQIKDLFPLVFEASDYNTITFLNAWTGFYSQAQDLITKIMDTWHAKVEKTFLKTGLSMDDEEFIAERNKGLNLEYALEKKLRACEVNTFASIAHELLEIVYKDLSKNFSCSQCQAALEVKKDFFRSYYSTCLYCQTVNTFEPGIKARNIEHFAIDAIGNEAAHEQMEAYEYAKFQNYLTDKKIFRKKEILNLYKEYLIPFLKKRIEIIPEYADRYEKDLESKLEFHQL